MADEWQPDPNLPIAAGLQDRFRRFKTPEGQAWGAKAIAIIQAHNDARQVAQQADAVRAGFIKNLADTKNNLVGLVKQDPASLHMALQLAHHTVQGLAGTSGVDDAETHGQNVTQAMYSEIAHTAVQSMAEKSGKGAHALLDGLGGVIPDSDIAALRTYTDNMTSVRRSDAQAQMLQQQMAAVNVSGQAALGHLGALIGPSGELQFPPQWGQRALSHPAMLNADKMGLWGAFDRLRRNGDMPGSDPAVVSDIIGRAALPLAHPDHPAIPEIIGQVGQGLSVQDAQFLGGLVGPRGPQQRDHVQALNDILDVASQTLNDRGAMHRFSNWVLPAYQRAAAAGVAPGDITAAMVTPERLEQFQPTGDDMIAPVVSSLPPASRPSLWSIFAGEGPPDTVRSGDTPKLSSAETTPEGWPKMDVPDASGDIARQRSPAEQEAAGEDVYLAPKIGVSSDMPAPTPNDLIGNHGQFTQNLERET